MAEEIKDVSYCVGLSLGSSLAEQNLQDLDVESISLAIQDVFSTSKPRFTPEEANQIIQLYLRRKSEEQFADNLEKGSSYLAENANRPEITVTASGLQYEVLNEGSGPKPTGENTVTVHYHGTLIDGTVFDSSVQRGTPASFGVRQVISGWTEALQLMPLGSKYKLYIPQDLAYGANPHPGGAIQPYMALIFEVELIDIK